jgi:hypothetical protein
VRDSKPNANKGKKGGIRSDEDSKTRRDGLVQHEPIQRRTLLFFTPTPSQEKEPQKKDIDPASALGIFAVLAVAIFSQGKTQSKLEAFYFRNYEWIYYGGFTLGLVLVGIAIWLIIRSTKDLTSRMRLLSPVSHEDAGIFAGVTSDGLRIYVPEKARTGHVQIIGATGRGKTESVIFPWLMRDLAEGRSAVVLDGKGDPELAQTIKDAGDCLTKPPRTLVFDLGNPASSAVLNPLSHGTPQQITDRLFTALTFREEYYKSVQYDICQKVVSLLHERSNGTPGAVTIKGIYELLTDDGKLGDLASECCDLGLKDQILWYLTEKPETREKNTKGLVSQLSPFAVGEVSALVNGKATGDEREVLSISETVLSSAGTEPVALVILIPTLMYQEIGQQLGRLLLQELSWAVGQRASQPGGIAPFLPVFLDEFASFVYPGFTNVLNKARSSNVALHLSHQSLGDLGVVSREFATIVNTNTNIKCLLGLNDPETADFFARHMGTLKDEKTTERARKEGIWSAKKLTGEMSVREVESYRVHPNDLKNFTAGEGVLHMPSPRGNITEVIQFERISHRERCFN